HPSKLTKENSNVQQELLETCDSDEEGDNETEVDYEPDLKRRNTEVRLLDPSFSHGTVSKPKIIVQTTSDVDLLEDGYRWRKYGQKVVKGNPYP
ncbi:putative WRKY transcription factor 3-like, partial [Trifolium medium]|nr:putative WRKY transcription factor 3-like [Trifolium medium]